MQRNEFRKMFKFPLKCHSLEEDHKLRNPWENRVIPEVKLIISPSCDQQGLPLAACGLRRPDGASPCLGAKGIRAQCGRSTLLLVSGLLRPWADTWPMPGLLETTEMKYLGPPTLAWLDTAAPSDQRGEY